MQDKNTKKQYKIAVDAMGGDYAPAETIKGALQAADKLDIEIILVGLKSAIEAELIKLNTSRSFTIVDAPDMIKDGEEPAYAVMRKKNNSIAVATRLVKEGKADAVVSAGNTGAMMVCALQYLGTLPGIERLLPAVLFAASLQKHW
jgi:glycerol-3-phosphate acyltransferase PlsX